MRPFTRSHVHSFERSGHRIRLCTFVCCDGRSVPTAVVGRLGADRRREVSLVVTNGIVVTMDADRARHPERRGGDRRRRHRGVDTADAIRKQFRGADTIDASGQIVLPGLINTHTHAPMVLFRGLADDLALMEWLNKYIFPAEAKTVSPEFVRAGTRLAALEMIQSGTTTYADMYYFEEEIARETKAAGLRGVLGQTVIQFPVRRREDAGRCARARRDVHHRLQGRPAHHAGRGAARDLHARRPDAARRARPRRGATACRR